MSKKTIQNIALAAMFIAIGVLLPFLTGQIRQIGKMLLPMHLPVFLCAMICGWKYGLAVGAILPLLRSTLFSMPPMFPGAVAMSFELLTYGLLAGLLYAHSRKPNLFAIYRALIVAMVGGRLVWGVVQFFLLGFTGSSFTWSAFLAGAVLDAIPGIVLQLILIPAVLTILIQTGALKSRR